MKIDNYGTFLDTTQSNSYVSDPEKGPFQVQKLPMAMVGSIGIILYLLLKRK